MLPENARGAGDAGAPAVRIGDAERERVVALLREHCVAGRITLDEFSDRVGVVFAARTAADLAQVTSDLPSVPSSSTPAPVETETPARRRARVVRWTVSIFGGHRQSGRWRVEGSTTAVSIMGGCLLDLRAAEVVGSEVVINAFSYMGSVDIVVPEGIEVVLGGFSIMGGRNLRVADVPVIPGSPLVRVRAFALMGGVTVRSRGDRSSRRREALDRPSPRRHHRQRGLPPPDRRRRAVAEAPAALDGAVAPDGTVTILFSDVEGFTGITDRLGDQRAQQLLREHYRLVRDEVARHQGFEVKVQGDGFMLAFSSASRALRCARAIQQAQERWNAGNPEQPPLQLRMGLHTGEAIRDAGDFLGATVNVASRISDAACGGEILVSSLLRELCSSSGEFAFHNGREIELKGLSEPYRVFSVDWR